LNGVFCVWVWTAALFGVRSFWLKGAAPVSPVCFGVVALVADVDLASQD
jgi:hypothetical protein